MGPSEVTQLLDRRPEWLTVRSTLALALLREGRAQAAADVHAGWKIDWASASDRCKAVCSALLCTASFAMDPNAACGVPRHSRR